MLARLRVELLGPPGQVRLTSPRAGAMGKEISGANCLAMIERGNMLHPEMIESSAGLHLAHLDAPRLSPLT